jgi:uncharacterized protein
MPDIVDNAAAGRFELDIDGHVAAAYYRRGPDLITFTHTEVPKALGGRGIGSRLAAGALDLVRAEGLRVVAQCEFIAAFIAKNPQYSDLLTDRT